MIKLQTPITKEKIEHLNVGDFVHISGTIYTARDAAHKKIVALIKQKQELPFELKDATIYYVGPTPTPPNHTFGSAGPTTSIRMDSYAPTLYDLGVSTTIGKGYRTAAVIDSIRANKALYLVAIGGAGALLGSCIKKATLVAFRELGAEAILKLEVVDFPATVAIDSKGNNIYE